MIDITVTTVLRPSLLHSTLLSFTENLFVNRDDYRLIVNIDPIGEDCSYTKVLDVCYSFFKNVVYNYPKEASFSRAVKWVWSQSFSNLVFHLEDDWLLSRKVDIKDMINILQSDKEIACLRMSKSRVPDKRKYRDRIYFNEFILFNAVYKYTGKNYSITEEKNQLGLNPVLIKREFITEALPLMVDNINPEKQFRISNNEKMNSLIRKWKYAIYCSPGSSALVIDNGIEWKNIYKFKKPKGSSFLRWER